MAKGKLTSMASVLTSIIGQILIRLGMVVEQRQKNLVSEWTGYTDILLEKPPSDNLFTDTDCHQIVLFLSTNIPTTFDTL